MRKNKGKYIFGLTAAFVAVIIVGRYGFYRPAVQSAQGSLTSQDSPSALQTSSLSETSVSSTQRDSSASDQPRPVSETKSSNSVAGCIEAMTAEVEKNKTQYEKGSILVGFVKGVTYESAISTLATYGMTAKTDANTKTSYSSNQLLTAFVQDDTEIAKICTIKRDQSVKYAGLNAFFELHD